MGTGEAIFASSQTSVAYTALTFAAVIAGSFTFLSVCGGVHEHSFCPTAWGGVPSRQQTFTAAPQCPLAPMCGAQILGGMPTFLPPDAIARGTSNYGSGDRMERLGHKLLQGQPVTVAFLGGSITWGRGGYEGAPFVIRFTTWLNATFPHPDHRVVNLGLPAVTSALFAACYDSVPEDADFVVLDFAVNDGHTSPPGRDKYGYSFPGATRRGFEQLVRKSLKLQESPAVAMLHFFSWNATRDKEREGTEDVAKRESFFFRTIEDDLSTIAQYYDTPVLSLRNAVYHLLREQRFGFQWDAKVADTAGMAAAESEPLKDALFFWDENHPWDRTGHRALAELLQAAVSRGVQAAADMQLTQLAQAGAFAQLPAAARAKLAQERPLMAPLPLPLPPPMVPGNYEANATSCHLQEDFEAVVGATSGFKYEARAPNETTYVAQKWGLTANKTGARATITLDSELGGLSGKLESVQVHLLFLRSWRGMGKAQLECSGCKCAQQELDGHWDREATLTDLFTFEVSPYPKCELHLTVLANSTSGQHLFVLSGAVVSSLDAKLERGKIGQWDYEVGG